MARPYRTGRTRKELNRESHLRRVVARKAAGLCSRCGKCSPGHGFVNCESCRAYVRAVVDRMIERGLCQKCCRRAPAKGCQQCRPCLDAQKLADAKKTAIGACRKCGKLTTNGLIHCETCLARNRARNRKLRDEVFAAYGGYRCCCCGETNPVFLQLDHINDDGAVHRKELRKNGGSMYQWLKRTGCKHPMQVLCANCNMAKRFGVCPHQQNKDVHDGYLAYQI